ncbi:MAG: PD-(D/E)XK nuclease family protein, partial [Desulfohalobiaceae bacterium]
PMPPFEPIDEEAALDRLREGAALITVNQRLARFFLHTYARRQQELGTPVFVTPRIQPFTGWVQDLLDSVEPRSGESEPIPLSRFQELMLWEDVLSRSELAGSLLRIAPAAQSAGQAFALCCGWRIPWQELDAFEQDEDTRAFTSWARSFDAECEANSWLDHSRIPDRIIRLLEENRLHPPQEIILCGFDEYTPQQMDLFDALERAGCPVLSTETAERTGEADITAYPDRTEEITAAAIWARKELERDPEQRIGVVAPDLSGIRDIADRIFRDVLHPQHQGQDPEQQLYNISLGQPLSEYPLVQAGLSILELARGSLDWREASGLILSPFLTGADSELTARSQLDADFRQRRATRLDLRELIHACSGAPSSCPLLVQGLQALSARVEMLPRKQSPADWAASFQELLEAVGWPGEQSLSSSEYQCRGAWVEAFKELASLGPVTDTMSLERALALFSRILGETSFQPEQGEAPVQILGVLEASGIGMDQLWIMGLDEGSWPTPARPNPFLPLQLQRSHGVPRCSPERELAFCRRVTRRLLASADRIRLSYPRQEGDTELFPSPLLPSMEAFEDNERETSPKWKHLLACLSSAITERITDRTAPVLQEGEHAPGGTGLLRSQAMCPFRAFARHRLGAEGVEDPEIGLAAASRGMMVHSALHRIWEELEDQESLLAKDEAELNRLTRQSAERAVEEMRGFLPWPFSRRFAALEVQRLQDLLREWLELEKERPPFRVHSCEQRQRITLEGLWLKTVADRIDSLPDLGVAIIDYKTGEHRVGEWFRERPGEPQIPLYCLASGDPVLAAAVARVSTGRCRFQGLTAPEAGLPGTKILPHSQEQSDTDTWEQLLADWRERLQALAREIRQGYAVAAPRDGEATCRDCDIGPLCRILEHHGPAPHREEEE